MVKIKDIHGNEYEIPNLKVFKDHIINLHTNYGTPDNTIHEENGFYFKVDENFLKRINNLK